MATPSPASTRAFSARTTGYTPSGCRTSPRPESSLKRQLDQRQARRHFFGPSGVFWTRTSRRRWRTRRGFPRLPRTPAASCRWPAWPSLRNPRKFCVERADRSGRWAWCGRRLGGLGCPWTAGTTMTIAHIGAEPPQRRPESDFDEVREFSQRKVDVIDLEANQPVSYGFVRGGGRQPGRAAGWILASADGRLAGTLAARSAARPGQSRVDVRPVALWRTPFVADMLRYGPPSCNRLDQYPVDLRVHGKLPGTPSMTRSTRAVPAAANYGPRARPCRAPRRRPPSRLHPASPRGGDLAAACAKRDPSTGLCAAGGSTASCRFVTAIGSPGLIGRLLQIRHGEDAERRCC